MRVLLDTHVFLWWITGDSRLSDRAYEVIKEAKNEVCLSAASGWEMAIKAGLGKLRLQGEPMSFIAEQLVLNGFESLPVRLNHALFVYSLPKHHRDPFDRLLVARAKLENYTHSDRRQQNS
jgi:PIN domain nuclease of toxin-antitoxin system